MGSGTGSAGAVIIGASHAGVQAAASLRQAGWQEPIHLLSAEADLPYHRPPLSKAFLLGEKTADQLLLRGESFYTQQGIDLHSSTRAVSIDLVARTVSTDGGSFGFAKLFLATGARARTLPVPGADLEGVFTLRDMADARRLKQALDAAGSVAIVGGGFIGLEVAATAAKHGKAVTVIEAQPRLLARSVPARLSGHLRDVHLGKGVRILFGEGVEAFEGAAGHVRAVKLAGGGRIEADVVLVGVGGAPDLTLAEPLGLQRAAGGVLVDANGLTSHPDIYAIGDCASFDNPFAGGVVRLESVQNAVDQAKAAASHCAGAAAPLDAVPWFWTDQYDLKMQMAGIGSASAEEVVRGDPSSGAFSLLHLVADRLVAAFSVNRPADHMMARKLIASGARIDRIAAADVSVPLARAVVDDGMPTAAQ